MKGSTLTLHDKKSLAATSDTIGQAAFDAAFFMNRFMKKIITTILATIALTLQTYAELILIDFGAGGAGWYGGATVTGADANGNHWNSVTSGSYYSNLVDSTGTATSLGGFGFLTSMTFGSYNGPAGATSNPLTQTQIDATVFTADAGYFGVKEALVDYVKTSVSVPKVQWVMNGLDSSLLYTVKFYGSAKYQNDYATRLNVYNDSTFTQGSLLDTAVANYQSPTQSWVINTSDIGVIDNLTASTGSLYFEMEGANGGSGVMNVMSIEALPIPEPTVVDTIKIPFKVLLWLGKDHNSFSLMAGAF